MTGLIKVLGAVIGFFIMAGLIIGLFTTGMGLIVTILVMAFKVGLVLAPIAIVCAVIWNILIW